MRLVKFFLIICGMLLVVVQVQGNNLQETNADKPIVITPTTSTFSINLKSNPTTGFSWRLKKYPHHIISPIEQKFYPAKSNLIGAGGIESFRFKICRDALHVKELRSLTFVYMRPWNLQVGRTATFYIINQ